MRTRIWLVIIVVALASFAAGAALASRYVSWELASTSLMRDRADLQLLESLQAQLAKGDADGASKALKQRIEIQRKTVEALTNSVRDK